MTIQEMDDVIQDYCYRCDICAIQDKCAPINGQFLEHPEVCKDAYKYLIDVVGVKKADPVNHPSHYNKGTIEVADFIADQKLNFDRGNAVKYLCRAGSKDPDKEIQDLRKAIWYIEHEIKMLKGE